MINQRKGRPVIFGEVLYDCFPDGSVVMGGAPLNVAWHLKGFGMNPLLISRLGKDDNGDQVVARLEEWGLDLAGIQHDSTHPTGRVEISLNETGQPEFDILPHQAYDYIEAQAASEAVSSQQVAMLYHGSLAVRNADSMHALSWLRREYSKKIFVDINLRVPWWDHGVVDELVTGAHWLKLNDDELIRLAGTDRESLENSAIEYANKYKLRYLILTLGDQGACVIENGHIIKGDPVKVSEVADTVGAGDAFSSVTMLGILQGWPAAAILPRALEFAALLCTNRGATLSDPAVYTELLDKWGVS